MSHEEFIEKVKCNNIAYRNNEFKILGTFKNYREKIKVENEFGVCYIRPSSLYSNKRSVNVMSAENKTLYTINRFKKVHGRTYKYPLDNIYTGKFSIFSIIFFHFWKILYTWNTPTPPKI